MSESSIADRFIYAALTDDNVNLIPYKDVLPESAVLPAVVFQQTSGTDKLTGNGYRIYSEFVYLIKVIGLESYEALESIVDAIDSAVNQKFDVTVSTDEGILSSIRIAPFEMQEESASGMIFHRGAYYRIRAKRG